MNQIVDAIRYIHSKNVIHRDLKLDNIMVSFDSDIDKANLNMMRARIKIIDFGFAIKLTKSNLAFSALGSPINMDPIILKKFAKRGGDINKLGYDSKADIWSLGTICYEMLIGQAVFNAETMNELVKKVETGSYNVPTSVSKEMVSFLNGMLQYESDNRLSAEELAKHPFLTKRVNDFTKINTKQVSRKIDNKGLNINVKKNQTIWAIFNEEDEKKLVNIKGGRDLPAPEGPIAGDYTRNKRSRTETNIPRIPYNNNQQNTFNNNNIQKAYTNQYPTFNSFGSGNSFYGQSMHPSPNFGGSNQTGAPIQPFSGMQRPGMMPGIQQMPGRMMPGMQQMPGGMMSGMQQMPGGMMPGMQQMSGVRPGMQQMPTMDYNTPMMNNYPTFGVPMPNSYSGGIYTNNNNNNRVPQNIPYGYNQNRPPNSINQYAPYNNEDDNEKGNICSIQ